MPIKRWMQEASAGSHITAMSWGVACDSLRRVNNLLTHLDRFAVFPRASPPAPQCGTGVLARQIAENGVQMSKLQRESLAIPFDRGAV